MMIIFYSADMALYKYSSKETTSGGGGGGHLRARRIAGWRLDTVRGVRGEKGCSAKELYKDPLLIPAHIFHYISSLGTEK